MSHLYATYNAKEIPTVACINKTTVGLGMPFPKLLTALQKLITDIFSPVWGTPAHLVEATTFLPGAWGLVFADDSDISNALGYHYVTPTGQPLGYVFVRTSRRFNEPMSVVAAHEICEMLIDPSINLTAQKGNTFYAYEVCDAVQGPPIMMDGVPVANFVYPAWFESFRRPKSVPFDHLRKTTRPFQILRTGYMPVFRQNRWVHIYGSTQTRAKYQRYHRETGARRGWKRSDVKGREGEAAIVAAALPPDHPPEEHS